jgi:hypothetical protein
MKIVGNNHPSILFKIKKIQYKDNFMYVFVQKYIVAIQPYIYMRKKNMAKI